MLMIKAFGALAVVLCGMAAGFEKALRLAERKKTLYRLELALYDIRSAMEYKAATTSEILEELVRNGFSDFFRELDSCDLSGSLARSAEFKRLNLSPSEKTVITEVFERLGTSDLETQLSMLDFQIHRFSAARQEFEASYEKRSRLYKSLGFLGGVFVSLLLL